MYLYVRAYLKMEILSEKWMTDWCFTTRVVDVGMEEGVPDRWDLIRVHEE